MGHKTHRQPAAVSMVKLAGDWRLDIGHSLLGQI